LGCWSSIYAGAFPLWLAPVQVGIVPISERHLAYAEKLQTTLQNAGFRVEVDHRNEKMGAKIRDFTLQKIPYILVVGDKEAETGAVSLRVRGEGDKGSMPLEEFVSRAKSLVDSRSVSL
jgi:threonyl-tRNA synthetase